MRALCYGSLNIDYVYQVPHFVSRGETLAAGALQRFSGGKGLNQAIALARAGMEVHMAGAVGLDGDFLLDELRDAGVDVSCVRRAACPTGHAIIQNVPDGDNCILLYGGANRTVDRAQAEEVLARFAPGDLLLVQNEISSLADIIALAKERGMIVALNPSPMEDALKQLPAEHIDLLILNEGEAAHSTGEAPDRPERLLARLEEFFPDTVLVLTLGEKGSICCDRSGMHRQSAFRVVPVDTTGAGDTFTGFFLAAYLQDRDAAQALALASRAAAIAVTRPGAAPSIPTRAELRAALGMR
ncbi:MAG: ribokinase [Oscillospiraceae bacterium]|nr:ribokinase [Oscillospiraceae bacterium]